MKHPVFYFSRLSKWDIWTISLYLLVSVFLALCKTSLVENGHVLGTYAIVTQFFLYFFNYKSLRNLTSFIIWGIFGVYHLVLYYLLKDESVLQMANGHAATPLRNTVLILLLFQILRIISLNVRHQEFVALSRGAKYDLFEEREFTIIDVVILFLFLGAIVGLAVWN